MHSNSLKQISKFLDLTFDKYHKKKYVCSDPLEFLYNYRHLRDREIVGLVSSALSYGRVSQILKNVSHLLQLLGPSPFNFVRKNSYKSMLKILEKFRYRFSNGKQMAALLFGIKKTLQKFKSLNNCFQAGMKNNSDIFQGLNYFTNQLNNTNFNFGHLIPNPSKKSACKRLNLFLRWMVRTDNIDPGGWSGISVSSLIIPLDVHMHRIGMVLGFTERKSTTLQTALEITSGFKLFSPEDPVRHDFSLTRLGILGKTSNNKNLYTSLIKMIDLKS